MTSLGKWSATTLTTIMSTELNSLTSGSGVSTSGNTGPYDNTVNKDIYADIEVVLAALSPAAGGYCTLWCLESVDGGSNYPAPSTADLQNQSGLLLGTFPMSSGASTAQRLTLRNIMISPVKMNFEFINSSSVSLASSGNTVKILTYGFNLNA